MKQAQKNPFTVKRPATAAKGPTKGPFAHHNNTPSRAQITAHISDAGVEQPAVQADNVGMDIAKNAPG